MAIKHNIVNRQKAQICSLNSQLNEQAETIKQLQVAMNSHLNTFNETKKELNEVMKWRDCYKEQARDAESKIAESKYAVERCASDAERLGYYSLAVALRYIASKLVINDNIQVKRP